MPHKKDISKRILVCVPHDLLKRVDNLRGKYGSRSELIREALELLIVSHKKKSIEKELKEGFRLLKNLNGDFAEKSLLLGKEVTKKV